MSPITLPRLPPNPAVDSILAGKYPARAHAVAAADELCALHPHIVGGLIYLESARSALYEDSDAEAAVRQRRPFFYLSGCPLLDSHVTYDIASKKLTLYIPPVDHDEVIWSGLPMTVEEAKAKFDVDEVLTTDVDCLAPFLASLDDGKAGPAAPVFVLDGATQVSKISLPQEAGAVNTTSLREVLDELRVVKDRYEIALIRRANAISTLAHETVMRNIRSFKSEHEAEALFTAICTANKAPHQAYHGIFASGTAGATLHYVKNCEPLQGKLNMLLDAGCEVDCYASDITRTFPLSGSFTKESAEIYDIVYAMQEKCIARTLAGVAWEEVHELAHRVCAEGLLLLGILRLPPGTTVEHVLEARTTCAFFPHGLGHWLGMDTHDTGGRANYKDTDPMFRYLRVRRKLVKGGVITVEPGIYFCKFIIDEYLKQEKHARFVDTSVLEKYWDVGGVRIEDNVLVVGEHENENLTGAIKNLVAIEALCRGD